MKVSIPLSHLREGQPKPVTKPKTAPKVSIPLSHLREGQPNSSFLFLGANKVSIPLSHLREGQQILIENKQKIHIVSIPLSHLREGQLLFASLSFWVMYSLNSPFPLKGRSTKAGLKIPPYMRRSQFPFPT